MFILVEAKNVLPIKRVYSKSNQTVNPQSLYFFFFLFWWCLIFLLINNLSKTFWSTDILTSCTCIRRFDDGNSKSLIHIINKNEYKTYKNPRKACHLSSTICLFNSFNWDYTLNFFLTKTYLEDTYILVKIVYIFWKINNYTLTICRRILYLYFIGTLQYSKAFLHFLFILIK